MDRSRTDPNRAVTFQYARRKISHATINIKTLVFLSIIVVMTSLDDANLKRSIPSMNAWDVIFDVLNNRYIQLYFFLLFFLFYVYEICHDKQISRYTLLRLGRKINWLYAKAGSLLVWGTVYTCLYVGFVFLVAVVFQGYDSRWSSNVSAFHHGMYAPFVTPAQVLGMIVIRYLVGVWLMSLLYLLVYSWCKKNRNLKAMLVVATVLFANGILNVNFFRTFFPFLGIEIGYLAFLTENPDPLSVMIHFNAGPAVGILCILFLLRLTIKKLEFWE